MNQKELKLDIRIPAAEAKRLWKIGVIQITWLYDGAPQDRPFTAIGTVKAHLVDSEGRDGFLFQQLNPADRKFLLRSIPVNQIISMRTASYDEVTRDGQAQVSE